MLCVCCILLCVCSYVYETCVFGREFLIQSSNRKSVEITLISVVMLVLERTLRPWIGPTLLHYLGLTLPIFRIFFVFDRLHRLSWSMQQVVPASVSILRCMLAVIMIYSKLGVFLFKGSLQVSPH